MFATVGSQRLTPLDTLFDSRARIALPIASVAGAVVAVLVALSFIAMPIGVIENMAVDSGVASMLTAAAPPLGLTARLAVAFFASALAGGITWLGLRLVVGARAVVIRHGEGEDGVPVLRRADAHPDAPARRPVFANSDLGTPFLDVKAEPLEEAEAEAEVAVARHVPADLDTPIADYWTPDSTPLLDIEPEPVFPPILAPQAESAVEPMEDAAPEPAPVPALTPVSAPRFAPHERIETFGLTAASSDDEPSTPLPQATIHDLLDRLERGVARRQPESDPPREQTLEETLDALRALARRVG